MNQIAAVFLVIFFLCMIITCYFLKNKTINKIGFFLVVIWFMFVSSMETNAHIFLFIIFLAPICIGYLVKAWWPKSSWKVSKGVDVFFAFLAGLAGITFYNSFGELTTSNLFQTNEGSDEDIIINQDISNRDAKIENMMRINICLKYTTVGESITIHAPDVEFSLYITPTLTAKQMFEHELFWETVLKYYEDRKLTAIIQEIKDTRIKFEDTFWETENKQKTMKYYWDGGFITNATKYPQLENTSLTDLYTSIINQIDDKVEVRNQTITFKISIKRASNHLDMPEKIHNAIHFAKFTVTIDGNRLSRKNELYEDVDDDETLVTLASGKENNDYNVEYFSINEKQLSSSDIPKQKILHMFKNLDMNAKGTYLDVEDNKCYKSILNVCLKLKTKIKS